MFVGSLSRSHSIPAMEVLRQLHARGYNVTILTNPASAGWMRKEFSEFHIHVMPESLDSPMRKAFASRSHPMANATNMRAAWARIMSNIFIPMYRLTLPYLKAVFEAERPALVLCDMMLDACSDAADHLDIPFVQIMSVLFPGVSDAPYTLSVFSPNTAPSTEHLTLWARFHNKIVVPAMFAASMMRPAREFDTVRAELGIKRYGWFQSPVQRYAHVPKLANTFFGFETPRPLDPLLHLFGPVYSTANTTLTPDLEAWLQQLEPTDPQRSSAASRSVVYLAFGQHLALPGAAVRAIVDALSDMLGEGLIDGAVWALSLTREDDVPAPETYDAQRIRLVGWAPQKALLAHSSVRVFVSHCGAESSHEGIFAGKPILGLPFMGDQPSNAAKLAASGMALHVPWTHISKEAVGAALRELLRNEGGRFAAAARRMRALAVANARHGTQRAADLLEYGLHYGFGHLQPASQRMSWVRANNWDIATLIVAVAAVLLVGLGRALKALAGAVGLSTRANAHHAPGKDKHA